MATTLKDFKFDLNNVSTNGSQFDSNKASVISGTGAGANTDAYVAGTDNTIVMTGFGTIKGAGTGSAGQVIFTGDANMQSGAYTASHDTNAKIKTFDASKASAKLSLTTDLVSVDGGVLKAGSGDDTIDVKANGAVTANAISVTGGLGADLFKISASSSSINVSDYNYAQGDRISVSALSGITQYGSGSNTMVLNSVSVDGYAADNVYKFGILEGANANKYDYVAAVSSANVNYTAGTDNLMFNADGSGNVVVDASKAANASITATVKDANITLGGNKDSETSVVAGQDNSDSSVVVDLGYGKDTVSVAAGAALTLKVGREDNVNVLKTALDSDDTLVLSSGKLSDIVVSGGNFVFGATSVNGALSTTASSGFKVQFGSGEAKKLAYAGVSGKAVEYNKDVSYYMGVGSHSISVATGFTDDVLLDMINDTSSIDHVDVTKADAKAKVDIIATGEATINAAAAAHKDVEWKFNLTANDTVAPDSLDVSGATGVDRIILSDSAKGNADKVKGFAAGEDILELSNVDKLTEKTFTRGANYDVVLQNSKASINGALASGTDLDVVLADGTAKKVALAGAGTGRDGEVVATQKTTTVINQDTVDGIVKFNIDEATENNAAFVVDMTGTVSNAIDYLGKFTSIDATVDAANALIVGNEAITNIKVTGSADHGAAVWAGAKANAEIDLSATPNHAGNIIWTGALDGASSVKGFEDKDKLYVYGVDGLSKTAVAESFGINGTNITYHTGASSMTFQSVAGNNINVMYMDSTAEGIYGYKKVSFNTTASGDVAYNTDVDVYIGTANATVTVSNDAVAEGDLVAINLSNKGAGSVEEGDAYAYYKGIHNIDASASAGTFLLIGDNSNGAKLTGGAKGNAIWGGGDASQTMTGFAGVADIFWFGSKDGHDVVANFGTKDGADGDAVFLYDATSIDAVQITAEGNNAKVVFKNTNSTLTLNNVSDIDGVKFMLNNADGGYDYYKYDSKTSAFVPQKA